MARGDLKKLLVDLEQKARGGDEKAKLELAKVRTLVRGAIVQRANQQRAQAAAAVNLLGALAAAEEEQEPEEAVGAVMPADALDLAEEIAKQQPRGDDLAHKAMLRKYQEQALKAQAPYVRIDPASAIGQQIGNTVICTNALDPNGVLTMTGAPSSTPQQVADWVGDQEETLPITVAFQPVGPIVPSAISKQGTRAYGIVQFGTRGYPANAEVDIGQGTQFTIPGSSALLRVGLEVAGGGNTDQFQYAGMISFWPTNKTEKVTRSFYMNIGVGANAVAIVPPYARSVQFLRFIPTDTVNILFRDSANVSAYLVTLAAGVQQTDPIPLSGDIQNVAVADGAGGAGLGQCRLIFNLEF